MEFESFSENQRQYLDLLTKYSGRTNRLKLLNPSDMGKRREVFITENLLYLTTNEQVGFNDVKLALSDAIAYSQGVFAVSFIISGIYFVIRTPSTKSLLPAAIKSAVIAGIITGGYYQYNYWGYQATLQKYYIRLLNNKRQHEKI